MTTPHVFYNKGIYSVTICPDDAHQYINKQDRLKSFTNFCFEQFISYPQFGIQYSFYTELSEVKTNKDFKSKYPRLHLHGIIKLCSKKAVKHFLLNILYQWSRWSIYDIDTIKDIFVWYEYCIKQQHIIQTDALTNNDQLWTSARSAIINEKSL